MNSRRWRQRHKHDVAELNITAFMNLMVILVPFLLITAVFSRLTILELSLPAPSDQAMTEQDKQTLQLEVVIRSDQLEVADTQTGILKLVPSNADSNDYDLAGLSEFLKQVKAQYPEKTDVTLLLEPDIEYDTLVQVMDTVRVFTPEDGDGQVAELFPDISIGDAAARAVTGAVVEGQ